MARKHWSVEEVLRFFPDDVDMPSRSTVKRHYVKWRIGHGLPVDKCDGEECEFQHRAISWRGKALRPELDHRDGANRDNRPKNLRLLCPMCHRSETETNAGANVGKVSYPNGNKVRVRRDGTEHYFLLADPMIVVMPEGKVYTMRADDTDPASEIP